MNVWRRNLVSEAPGFCALSSSASGGFRGIHPSFPSSSPWRWVTAVGGLRSDVVKRQQALEGCLLFNTW